MKSNDISEKKLDEIKYKIIELEDDNIKTEKYKRGEMVNKIKQIIKDVVDKKI